MTETTLPDLTARRPKRADARRNFDALLAAAREAFAENGTLVTRILRPDAKASASARPTSAISGSVKIADAALS